MINKVILIGNVGHSPDIRTKDDQKVANFSIATQETYKDKNGEKITTTEWVKLVAWRGIAEVVENYVHKGQQLYIEGKLRTTSHDNKDGVKVYNTFVEISNLVMLGTKKDAAAPEPATAEQPAKSHASAKAEEVYGNGSGYAESPVQDYRKQWEPDLSKQKDEDDPGNDLPF